MWRDLGMPSGHAYTKAFRTCKTCVGTEFCRYGVGDSTGARHRDRAAVPGARVAAQDEARDGRLPAQLLRGDDEGRRRRRDRGRPVGDLRRRRRRLARAQGRPALHRRRRTTRCCSSWAASCSTTASTRSTSSAPTTSSSASASTTCKRLLVDDAEGICARARRGDAGRRRRLRRSVAGGRRPVHPLQFTTVVKTARSGARRMSVTAAPHLARSARQNPARRGAGVSRRRPRVAVFRCRSGEVYATEADARTAAGRWPTAWSAVIGHLPAARLRVRPAHRRRAGTTSATAGHPSRHGRAERRADAGTA